MTTGVLVSALGMLLACSGAAKDEAPVVPVQLVQVAKATLEQKVTADAVLLIKLFTESQSYRIEIPEHLRWPFWRV